MLLRLGQKHVTMRASRRGIGLVIVCVVTLAGCAAPTDLGVTPTDSPTEGVTPVGEATAVTANGTLEVHFINVGQSDSILLITPAGETMLIDSGNWPQEGEYVINYLQEIGVGRIDHLVTSHADADHIGGHAAVIEYFETQGEGVGAVYDPGLASSSNTYSRYLDAVEEYDVPLYQTREGAQMPVEAVDVSVLGPPQDLLANDQRNENSLVLRVTHGETSFLFTGDAEVEGESALVEEYGSQLDSTVFKAGHHGSRSSSRSSLLDAVQPQVVVVTSAYDSQYGHPHEEALQRFASRSIPTYWTATHGNVVVYSNGSAVSIATQDEAPTDPTSLRSGDPVEPGTYSGAGVRETIVGTRSVAPTTDVATDGGGELSLVDINADAEGNDNENLNDEYVVLENTGESTLDLSGWELVDEAGKTFEFPDGFTLAPGERVTIHSGSGTDSATDLYWGQETAVWNNGGDTVTVRTDDGTVVIEESY